MYSDSDRFYIFVTMKSTRRGNETSHPNSDHNRARKSRSTLQNKVRLKVLPEQLTLFVNTSVTLKKCITQ